MFEQKNIDTKCENPTSPPMEGFNPQTGLPTEDQRTCLRGDSRNHPRFPYPVRTSVELPFLPTKEYGICDFSRSGMFLAFTDVRATRLTLQQNGVKPGAALVVRFTISLSNETHCCRVQARLVRITRHGIGIKFTPPNSWQLGALINLLSRAHEEVQPEDSEFTAAEHS